MERSRWYKDAVVYQIYPRSFCDSNGDGIGDLKGITSKLDYLKDLGINAIWLSPIYPSPNDDNGYDISDYRDILSDFGTMADFKEMLREMHARGIKLIMDFVGNHTSDEHKWFIDATTNPNSKYKDYYFIREGKKNKKPNNWTSFFGGDAWERIGDSNKYYLHLFSKKQPDLNWDNEKVREEMKNVLKYWLDLGVDGFRCDVITIISKEKGLPNGFGLPIIRGRSHYINGPHIHEYLHELNRDCISKYDSATVGETVMIDCKTAISYVAEDKEELDMLFSFEHMDVDGLFGIKWFLRKFSLRRFKKILSKWQNKLYGKGWPTLYLENHDQPRSCGRFGTDKDKYHDESAKMLATMMYFQYGTPFIYEGQEIGMTNINLDKLEDYEDIETHNSYRMGRNLHLSAKYLMKAVKLKSRDHARTPMQWDDSANAGFTKGKPWFTVNPNYQKYNVKNNIENEDSIYHYFQKLIKIRKENDIVRSGSYQELNHGNSSLYIYERIKGQDKILVICNFKDKIVSYKLPFEYQNAEILLSTVLNEKIELPSKKIVLQPYQGLVLILKGEKNALK